MKLITNFSCPEKWANFVESLDGRNEADLCIIEFQSLNGKIIRNASFSFYLKESDHPDLALRFTAKELSAARPSDWIILLRTLSGR